MAELVKFYSKIKFKNFINNRHFRNTDIKSRCKIIIMFSLFFNEKLTFQLIIIFLYFIFVDRLAECIVNNGNILTDGKWRCYYEMGRRICYRKQLKVKRQTDVIKYEQLK